MSHSSQRPVDQLFRAVFGDSASVTSASARLDPFLASRDSVFDLVNLRPAELSRKTGLSIEDATQLAGRANSLALYIARAFREQRQVLKSPSEAPQGQGVRALVELPTFIDQFKPDFTAAAPVDAIESAYSPLAYLIALLKWMYDEVVPLADPLTYQPLTTRRPELMQFLMDSMAVRRSAPALEIVNHLLEAQIKEKLGRDKDVDALLRRSRHPHKLPYDPDWHAITYVLGRAGDHVTLGDLIGWTDIGFPYFKNKNARGRQSDTALRLLSGLGPVQQTLLLESPYFSLGTHSVHSATQRVDPGTRLIDPDPAKSAGDFYLTNFGYIGLKDLMQVWVLRMSLRLDKEGVEAFFALADHAPTLSPNALLLHPENTTVSAAHSGAAYINATVDPAISLARTGPGAEFELQNIDNSNEHRMDRINRKRRLDLWLDLTPRESDRLIMAAILAEQRGGSGNTDIWISGKTLSALGLFQELRARYSCPAEDFAVFIGLLSPYRHGEAVAQFDLVFNSQTPYREPLQLEDRTFEIVPSSEQDMRIAHQICSVLNINFGTYRFLATLIAKSFSYKTRLECSLEVFSSFYRMVTLARLFKITPVELGSLLQTLDNGGDGWVAQLAGVPDIQTRTSAETPDALSVIRALMMCVQWCNDNDVSALWLAQNVNPVQVTPVQTDAQSRLLEQLRRQVQPVLLLEFSLISAGVPPGHNGQDGVWLRALATLVNPQGLMIGRAEESDSDYLLRATETIRQAVNSVMDVTTGPQELLRVEALILGVLMPVRAAQQEVVREALVIFCRLSSDVVLATLAWAQGTPYFLLDAAFSRMPEQMALEGEQGDAEPFLTLMVELERRSAIVRQFKISATFLTTLLVDEQYVWFNLNEKYEISINTVYYLSLYSRVLALGQQPEQFILDYLVQINRLPADMSPDQLRLVRDAAAERLGTFFGWTIRDVLECAHHVNPPVGAAPSRALISNLAQIDLLLRVHAFARQSGLDSTMILALGQLQPLASEQIIAAAAKNVLETLQTSSVVQPVDESREVGQSITTRCTVDSNRLVARLAGEKATYVLYVLDYFGKPLRGVQVYWNTDLGVMLTPESMTDNEGRTEALLQAGNTVGTAHVTFNLDFGQPAYGPATIIDCDEPSLNFDLQTVTPLPVEPVLAGRLKAITASVRLVDDFGNAGAGRSVAWATTHGEVAPSEAFTDENGFTQVQVSSAEAGVAILSVTYGENQNQIVIPGKIEFVDRPYLQPLAQVSEAVAGRSLQVQCAVAGLSGSLQPNEEVIWWTSADPTRHTVPSSALGISLFEVPAPAAGALTVFAQFASDIALQLEVEVASDVIIQTASDDYTFPVAGGQAISLWVALVEPGSGRAIPYCSVLWTVSASPLPGNPGPRTTRVRSTADGRSTLQFHEQKVGHYTVTAMLEGNPIETRTFKIEVIAALEWKVILFTEDPPEETIIGMGDTLNLHKGRQYRLSVDPGTGSPLIGSQAALSWSSKYRPDMLDIKFSPGLAARREFTGEPMVWVITCGYGKSASFELGLHCDRVQQVPSWPGTLSPLNPGKSRPGR